MSKHKHDVLDSQLDRGGCYIISKLQVQVQCVGVRGIKGVALANMISLMSSETCGRKESVVPNRPNLMSINQQQRRTREGHL